MNLRFSQRDDREILDRRKVKSITYQFEKIQVRQEDLQVRQEDLQVCQGKFVWSIWAEDEARLGLQPIVRRVWAPMGERPSAHHCRRYQWVYTDGFVHPATGASYFLLLPRANVSMMQIALELFAAQVNPYRQQWVILVVDQAAWHISQKLQVPAGIFLYPLLPYTPQLQPTECV